MSTRSYSTTPGIERFRDEAIATLLRAFAHDLNNALGQVLMTSSWLRGSEADADRRESLSDIEISAERAAQLSGELLAWSKGAPDGAMPFQLARLLRLVIADAASFSASLVATSIQLREPIWPVHANPLRVAAQVFAVLADVAAPFASGSPDDAVPPPCTRFVVRIFNVAPRSEPITLADDAPKEPVVCVSVTAFAGPTGSPMRRERRFISARPQLVLARLDTL